jgi:hypothetical protein
MVATMATEVKERPVLFSGPMVRAILEGRKTQTRRVIKPQPTKVSHYEAPAPNGYAGGWYMLFREDDGMPRADVLPCPYGKPGDRLWVRETFHLVSNYLGKDLMAEGRQYVCFKDGSQKYQDGAYYPNTIEQYAPGAFDGMRWRPAIYMPRWASRLTLEVTKVRAERLQDISDRDAKAEGICNRHEGCRLGTHVEMFSKGWDALNAKRGFSWESNPWVWVVEFRKA